MNSLPSQILNVGRNSLVTLQQATSMIDSSLFLETVRRLFSFLVTEFRMKEKNTTINGNPFYDIQFEDKSKIISISLENISDYFQVILFKLQGGQMPDYDDEMFTYHLDRLNTLAATKATTHDYLLNSSYFSQFTGDSIVDRTLLKAAKDLRLCLTLLSEA